MPSLAPLIYSGVIPLVKMWISASYMMIFFGYFFARKDLFPQTAAKGVSSVTINLALPALLFSSIVPAFTATNISAMGPLVVLAIAYIIIGLLFGLIIREVCYVPRNFWQGIIVASGLSNWSSMPTAMVVSITQSSPFDPATDTSRVSFASIFILTYHIFFWVCGLAHSLSWDYAPDVPRGEAANIRVTWREKPIGGFIWRHMLERRYEGRNRKSADFCSHPHTQFELGIQHVPKARIEEASIEDGRRTPPCSAHLPQGFSDPPHHVRESQATLSVPALGPAVPSLSRRVLATIAVTVTPISVIIAMSLFIALLDPLKALFVHFEGGPLWEGPDGKPPLAFVINTAQLIGAMSVPMTLFLLGVSFARMDIKMSKRSGLPVFAFLSVCAAKMILLPIIGVFITRAMITSGLIHPESKVQIFVAIFVSGTPSALNQLMVASTMSPDGKQDMLSALLFFQYCFAPFSSLALSTITLRLIQE